MWDSNPRTFLGVAGFQDQSNNPSLATFPIEFVYFYYNNHRYLYKEWSFMVGIYKITNKINGKCYIGQSRNIDRRWKQHKKASKKEDSVLYRAMRKYGVSNFEFEVLEECTKEDLNDRETFYISYYHSFGHEGYNRTPGGNSNSLVDVNKDIAPEIIHMLKTTQDNSEVIAKHFGISSWLVRSINRGESYHNSDEVYPIRQHLATIRKKVKQPQLIRKKKIKISNKTSSKTNQKIRLRIKKEKKCYTTQREKNFCTLCGALLKTKSTYCVSCAKIASRKADRPAPLELAKMIVDNGFESVGRELGVSGKAIAKWCKNYNIPSTKKALETWYYQQIGEEPPKQIRKTPQQEYLAKVQKQVQQLDPDTKQVINTYPSVSAAARAIGHPNSPSHISDSCKKGWLCYGYYWVFTQESNL